MNGCPPKRDIHTGRGSWLSVTILILSIYSTMMSGIWLITAFVQPRWGRAIHSGGSFSPSTASLLSALLAKTIELSFVTVFVSFLGQVLSRRAFIKSSHGINISEISMRTWIIQPGYLLTHFQTVKYAALTFLGAISLTAALVGLLYTTASDALVSPKLKFGGWDRVNMEGWVTSGYADPDYVGANCQTPIDEAEDPEAGTTCLAIEHAGQGTFSMICGIFYRSNMTGVNQN
jgi:hypothetical protein